MREARKKTWSSLTDGKAKARKKAVFNKDEKSVKFLTAGKGFTGR